ncbi:LOW QUALITY PROTEIN: CCSER1 isoform 11 [Pongo abelii]|uniref:CCSER1 isoform 11 n=2 Tax=Pongo abelii TaxID=9601 RepID=A0A2J8V5G4_PONAB|nr:LOW QUALITY PROTEIN: CCSER1 isoform 11 [Pongo abelii]
MSPASSTTSLPVSPLTEEPVPFKDIMKDECSMLKLQLKEKDELISQLQEELLPEILCSIRGGFICLAVFLENSTDVFSDIPIKDSKANYYT